MSNTVRFDNNATEQILLGVMQSNRMPVNLIQPALAEVLKILYQNGFFLAGDIRYPAVQRLIPPRPAQPPQQPPQAAPQQVPQYAPQQQYPLPQYQSQPPQRAPQVPPYYQPPQAAPQQAPQQFSVPGMQPPGVGFPPPPMGMPPAPPQFAPQSQPGQPGVPQGHPGSMVPIQPATWAGQQPAQASNTGLISQGPHSVPVAAPMMPVMGPPVGAAQPGVLPMAAPALRGTPNVVPGPFPTPTIH